MNEESDRTTFHNVRGKSNIDLTIMNTQILQAVTKWEICEEESCSDHSIIKFCIGHHRKQDRQKTQLRDQIRKRRTDPEQIRKKFNSISCN